MSTAATPSTRTPPLGRRVVLVGVTVVALVLLAVNTAVYAALRGSLYDSLDELLAERAETVRIEAQAVAATGGDGGELARRIQTRGLRAQVRLADGTVYRSDPTSPVIGRGLPPGAGNDASVSRDVDLGSGTTARVYASTSGVSQTLRRLLALQVVCSVLALLLAALLLSRASRVALRPVSQIAEASARTAAGQRGERLRPDRPDTELGRLATAYDAMLDSLEAGMQVAANLERRSGTFETRWRQVLEAAQEAYVAVDGDGVVVDWNRRAEELFAWPREEFVGRPVVELVPERYRELVTQALDEELARGAAPVGAPYELDAVTRDGRVFRAACTVWGVDRRGGSRVHMFVRDITDRRQSEEVASRLAAVVTGSSDSILTQDLHGTILTWNPAAERNYGWTAAEAVGKNMSLIVPESQLRSHLELLAEIGSGTPVVAYEGERLSKGGLLLPVSVRLSPVHDRQGRVVAVASIARDVTEQRWMAETLDNSLIALQAAVDEARQSEEATRRFLADAAHQLRTPMAGIRACAETLLRGAEPEDADRLLATMVRETSRGARLISSLLQIARLDQGLTGAASSLDVVRLCADEVERLSLLSPDLDIALDVRRAPKGPLLLDAGGCQEILSNLGDNARRHASSRIRISVDAGPSTIRIVVADDGPGVAEDAREKVFARFVSLDGRGGSGLGLPIARSLARSMGGDLRYEDAFVLELPVSSAQQAVEGDALSSVGPA